MTRPNDAHPAKIKQTNRTNITEPAGATYASSRGTLAASFLADPHDDSGLARAVAALTSQDPDLDATTTTTAGAGAAAPITTSYAGFNLLLLEPSVPPGTTIGDAGTELTYDARLLTNGGGGGRIRARTLSDAELASGGISNGVDGQGGDAWPKVVQGRATLRSVVVEHQREVEVDKDQDPEGESSPTSSSSGGPDREIADDAADAHLAERLIELLTYVCDIFPSCRPPFLALSSPRSPPRNRVFFYLYSFLYHAFFGLFCPRRAFHANPIILPAQRREDNELTCASKTPQSLFFLVSL